MRRLYESDLRKPTGRGIASFSFPSEKFLPGMNFPRGVHLPANLHQKGHGTVIVDFDTDEDEFVGVPYFAQRRLLDAVTRTIGFRTPVRIEISFGGRRGIGGGDVEPTYYIQAVQMAARNALYR